MERCGIDHRDMQPHGVPHSGGVGGYSMSGSGMLDDRGCEASIDERAVKAMRSFRRLRELSVALAAGCHGRVHDAALRRIALLAPARGQRRHARSCVCCRHLEVPVDAIERGDVTWGVCEGLMGDRPLLDITVGKAVLRPPY